MPTPGAAPPPAPKAATPTPPSTPPPPVDVISGAGGSPMPATRTPPSPTPPVPSSVPNLGTVTLTPRQVPGVELMPTPTTVFPWRDAAGNRVSLGTLVTNLQALGSAREKIAAIQSMVSRTEDGNHPMAYRSFQMGRPFRENPQEAWSLAVGECDAFGGLAAYLLVASGAVPRGDAYGLQIEGHSRHHNVAVFRDPDTGHWAIMNYDKPIVAFPGARSKEEAITSFLTQNGDQATIYEMGTKASDSPTVLYHIRSRHSAMHASFDFSPGIQQAMTGNPSTVRGLNDTRFTPGGLFLSSTFKLSDTRVEAAITQDPGAPQTRLGVGYLTQLSDTRSTGVKLIADRNTLGGGWSLTFAGESWSRTAGSFTGFLYGVDVRMDQTRAGSADQVSTIGPMFAFSHGRDGVLTGNSRFALSGFWNVNLAVRPMLAFGESASHVGFAKPIDAGATIGSLTAAGNAGVRTVWLLSNNLTFRSQATAHGLGADPTLLQWGVPTPIRASFEGEASLEARYGNLTMTLGGTGLAGALYDRDMRWSAWGSITQPLSTSMALSTSVSGGQTVSGQSIFDTRIILQRRAGDSTFSIFGGATADVAGGTGQVTPMLGLSYGM